jgi:hypothetical protein
METGPDKIVGCIGRTVPGIGEPQIEADLQNAVSIYAGIDFHTLDRSSLSPIPFDESLS